MKLKYKFDVPKNGIDVSKYQGNVNWNEVKKAGYEFVFVRLGYANSDGTIVIDPYFDRNMHGALFAQGFGGLSGGPIFEWFEWYRHQGKTLTTATFTSNFTGNIKADVQYTRVGDGQATVTIKKNGSLVSGIFSVRPRDTITISGHIQDNDTDGSETGGSVRVTLRRA